MSNKNANKHKTIEDEEPYMFKDKINRTSKVDKQYDNLYSSVMNKMDSEEAVRKKV